MAIWEYLGDAANLAQLTGIDAVKLIGMIFEAANTARLHKKNCMQFAEHLKLIGDLLEEVNISELKKHHATREPLEKLEDTLRRSYLLVNRFQNRNYLYLFAKGWYIVRKFRETQNEIDNYLKLIPLINLSDTNRIKERLESIIRNQCAYTFDDENMQDFPKFRVKLLSEGVGQYDMDVLCQVGFDRILILELATSRTLKTYLLEAVTRWEVLDSYIFAFWTKTTSVDVEPRRIRLKSNPHTTNDILDTVTAVRIRAEDIQRLSNTKEATVRASRHEDLQENGMNHKNSTGVGATSNGYGNLMSVVVCPTCNVLLQVDAPAGGGYGIIECSVCQNPFRAV